MSRSKMTTLVEEDVPLSRAKRGASSISIGPPVVYKGPGNHTVEVGQDFQFYCKIKANPLAHVAMKHNPDLDNPITVSNAVICLRFHLLCNLLFGHYLLCFRVCRT